MSIHDPQRREWLTRAAQAAGVAACGGLVWNAFLVRSAKAAPWAPRPPGARTGIEFDATCIKCGVCLEACPYGTLKLATVGDGPALGTPFFEPRSVPCFMCPDVPCAKACPTGALDREIKSIDSARMGLAVIDPETCLSWQGLRCEVCYRVCPVRDKAISIQPHPRQISKHAVFVPVVHAGACTGCGVCTQACPTEVSAINIVNPASVRGKMGEHYRLGWKDDPSAAAPATTEASAPAPEPAATPAPAAPATAPKAPGLDYLNSPL
ncbi:MAG: ferredoxin-type protein NapG [Burkholderiaceae bacterium]